MAKEGDRVQLIYTNDPDTKLKGGDQGTVAFKDAMGTVHVNWDNGETLGMTRRDNFKVVTPEAQQEGA